MVANRWCRIRTECDALIGQFQNTHDIRSRQHEPPSYVKDLTRSLREGFVWASEAGDSVSSLSLRAPTSCDVSTGPIHHSLRLPTIMSISQADVMKHQNVTPPPRFTDQSLTPPLTDKKPFAVAHRVVALFRHIYAGSKRDAETEFQLADGEYDQIQSTVQQDNELSGFVDNKIR